MRRTGRLLLVVSLIAGLMALGEPAHAAEVLIETRVAGSVYQADSCLGDLAGQRFSFTAVYDASVDDIWLDDQIGLYPGAVTEATGSFGPHEFMLHPSAAPFSEVEVVNDHDEHLDLFYISVPLELRIGSCPVINEVGISFSSTADPFSDDSLPTEFDLMETNALIDFRAISGTFRKSLLVRGTADEMTIAPVVFDQDADGVADDEDLCPETNLSNPAFESVTDLGVNRYALVDGDTVFDTNTAQNHEIVYTTVDTGGCNATQIADALGLGKSHYEKGITRSVLESWVANVNG